MTLTNHVPDQSQETALSVSTPSVEWMPLDGLVQQWTQALSAFAWPRAEALQASSAALRALALETSARRCYLHGTLVRAWEPPVPELVGQHLSEAFGELVQARQHWQAVAEWLERLARECRREERACYPLLCTLFTALSTHQSYLCQMLSRLADELVPATAAVQRAMLHTLAQEFGMPEVTP